MENTTEKVNLGKVQVPTKETIVTWVKRDAGAAAYFMNMLVKYPDIIEKIAEELYSKAIQERHDAELLNQDH